MKIAGCKLTLEQTLMAMILDDLNLYLWSKKKHRGARPKSVYKELTEEKKPKDELMSFASPEDFETWRRKKREVWDNG